MATLQERLARGDPVAFGELYDACADRLGHYLLVRLGSRADAEDALQETFLRLARARKKLATVDGLEGYVFTVARNEASRMVARRARRQREKGPPAAEDLFRRVPGNTETHEIAEIVTAAMGRLSPELREVVELKIYAGLTFHQISQVTGLPQGTVATRYRSALASMQSWLSRQR